jgi:hypothetical protein
MKVFVQASHHEDLFVVSHRLRSKELFWLLQGALSKSLNLVRFNIEIEAVGNPPIVSTENQNFRIIQSERSESVSR